MNDIILDVSALPEPLHRHIHSEKVKVHEAEGVFVLIPIVEKQEYTNRLFGMFSDGKMSTEKYISQKQKDKELER